MRLVVNYYNVTFFAVPILDDTVKRYPDNEEAHEYVEFDVHAQVVGVRE